MDKALLPSIAIVLALFAGQAQAKEKLFTCSNPHGQFTLQISRRSVLIDGKAPAGLELKSIAITTDSVSFVLDMPELVQYGKLDLGTGAYTISGRLPSGDQELSETGGSCKRTEARHRLF